jgi:hypothetical protein
LHDVHFSNLPLGAATSQHLVQQPPQYAEATASSLSETSIVPAQLIEIVDNVTPVPAYLDPHETNSVPFA